MILSLLFINLIIALIFMSGFWDVIDSEIGKKVRFAHLPHILSCGLCQVWWLSLLYIIVTGNLTLLNITLCLVNAHLIEITIPLLSTLKGYLLKIIEIMNKPL